MIRTTAAILLALALALPARAVDLTLSAGGEVEYDDNAFKRTRNPEDDVFFRLRPGVQIHEDRGEDLNFSLRYEVPLSFAVKNSRRLNDVDHLAAGEFSYRLGDRVEITGVDRFRYLRGILRDDLGTESVISGTGVPEVSQGRERVRRNDALLGLSYHFSPRWLGTLRARHEYFDSSLETRSTVGNAIGSAEMQYTLNRRQRVGGGVRFSFQDFEATPVFSGSQTNAYSAFGSWVFAFDKTATLEVSAGPTFLETVQEDAAAVSTVQQVPFAPVPGGVLVGDPARCRIVGGQPVLPCGFDQLITDAGQASAIQSAQTQVVNVNPRGGRTSRWTFFANALATKTWTPTLQSALRYTRREGGASGLGGAVITDAVSFSTTWGISERWQLSLRGDWARQESVSDQVGTFFVVCSTDPASLACGAPGGIAGLSGTAFNAQVDSVRIDLRRWGVGGRLGYRLFRNTRAYVGVTYDEQESRSGTRGATSDFTNFLATLGVRHVFEPLKLW